MSEDYEFEAPTVEELQKSFTQYRIDKHVALGGMGAVYRATQLSVDRPVAFKILSPEYAGNEKFRKRFALEAKAMAKLSHRNIVQLYDFGETDGIVWMVQEWIPGKTVEDVLEEEGALEPAEAAAIVAQACEGLGYAHKQGIVHRDVKPANMMQDREGIVKVMDFGLAHASHWEEPSLQSNEGARYATTEYAGPEIWDMEQEPDHRVDIFALGVLLFEALTGERPMDPFRPPSEVRPGLDPRYDQVVIRSMQTRPENRYQSCEEFLRDLREVVTTPPPAPTPTRGQLLATPASGPVPVLTGARRPTTAVAGLGGVAVTSLRPSLGSRPVLLPRKPKKSNTALWVMLGLLAAIGAAVLMLIFFKGEDPPPPPPPLPFPTPDEMAGNASGTPEERARQKETPKQRVERLAKEQLERLKKLEEEKANETPEGEKPPEGEQPEGEQPEGEQPEGE